MWGSLSKLRPVVKPALPGLLPPPAPLAKPRKIAHDIHSMRVSSLLFLFAASAFAATPTANIKVDQVGYPTSAPKLAMVAGGTAATEFTVRRAKDASAAFHGRLTAPTPDADSSDTIRVADFSKLTKTGAYYLEVPGVGRSWEFAIGPNPYAHTWYLAMRSYYGQRCGIAVDLGPEFPGYRHDACHLEGAYHAVVRQDRSARLGKGLA